MHINFIRDVYAMRIIIGFGFKSGDTVSSFVLQAVFHKRKRPLSCV